jgi:hypothetical protein
MQQVCNSMQQGKTATDCSPINNHSDSISRSKGIRNRKERKNISIPPPPPPPLPMPVGFATAIVIEDFPNVNDVVLSFDGLVGQQKYQHHDGNERFRKILEEICPTYHPTTGQLIAKRNILIKNKLAFKILNKVIAEGVRFIEPKILDKFETNNKEKRMKTKTTKDNIQLKKYADYIDFIEANVYQDHSIVIKEMNDRIKRTKDNTRFQKYYPDYIEFVEVHWENSQYQYCLAEVHPDSESLFNQIGGKMNTIF